MIDNHRAVLFGGWMSDGRTNRSFIHNMAKVFGWGQCGGHTNRVFILDVYRMVRSYLMDMVTLSTSPLLH